VAGWSAVDLRWEGVSLQTVYGAFIEPALPAGTTVTHLVFRGLDGYRSSVTIGDALGDVLIAEHLDGRPLDGDHGAPARLLSPSQYGYINTKHLCRIEVHTAEPQNVYRSPALRLLAPHPRARVWEEERHRYLPAWSVRHVYRSLIGPLKLLSARGGEKRGPA
jgi:DMSO/TMAO reductase YedYZ molybdopterin-dependent catalytic subunit